MYSKRYRGVVSISRQDIKRVMITGGMGYIGTVVTQYLQEKGYEVDIIDLKCGSNIFDLTHDDMEDIDAVIHLAAVVGEGACKSERELAYETNVVGSKHIRDIADGIPIIFASTCSIYGPCSWYKKTKQMAEQLLKDSCILRFGTAFGWSPTMRYNLVLNKFVLDAKMKGQIIVFGGEQWRPFIHVKDIARAIYTILKLDYTPGTYNLVGENIQILNLAKLVQCEIPHVKIDVQNHVDDKRSYKSENQVPLFFPKYGLHDGIREIARKIWFKPQPDHLKLTKWNWMVSYPDKLKIGDHVDIGAFSYLNAQYGIQIEDNVQIGSHVSIYSANSENEEYGPVTIGANSKIGSYTLILPNSHIKENSKIKAYSIVRG